MKLFFNRVFILIPIIAILSACGTATSVVEQSATHIEKVHSINIVEAPSTVQLPSSVHQHLLKSIERELYHEQGFNRGGDLTLEYTIVSYQHGNRLQRFLSEGLGNWGEGGLMIKTTFADSKGNVVGALSTRGKIDSGIFGGSMKFAADRVAEEIGQYVASNYR